MDIGSRRTASPSRMVVDLCDGRAVAQAEGTQAQASLLRIRRACIASGSAWTVSSCLSSELYAICSRSLAGHMQPQGIPCRGWSGG